MEPVEPPSPTLRVSVAYSPGPGIVDEVSTALPAGATAADALRASGVSARHPALDLAAAAIGIWGVRCAPDHVLRDGDRVEVYRALCVDPKEARRLRVRKRQVSRSPRDAVTRRAG